MNVFWILHLEVFFLLRFLESQSKLSAQNLRYVGNSSHRHNDFRDKLSASFLLLLVLEPTSLSPRCPNQSMEVSSSICVSAGTPDTQSSPEIPEGEGVGNSDCSFLAQKAVVHTGLEN